MPATAEGWCARLHADDVSEADREAFDAWIRTAPENRAEYELCALTFAVANGLSQAPHLRRLSPATSNSHRNTRLLAGRRVVLAAGVALAVLAGGVLLRSAWGTSYATDVGERRLIALDDGSTVQLNTASTISVDLQPARRSVTLRRGEAFFNVAPDAGRPFVVRAGNSEIRVVGTKFNVRVDGNVAAVTVVDGKVNVVGAAGENAASTPLSAGQGAVVAASEPVVARLPEVNAARLTSWREGRIYFEQDPLSKVIEEVNRYSEIQFVIPDARTRALTLSGVFQTGDTDAVAFALREGYGLRTERDGRRIVVRPAS